MGEEKDSGKKIIKGGKEEPLYTIGVASRLLNCEPSTLRRYERAGLIKPLRTEGNTRLYSELELERLSELHELVDRYGLNMAGARMVMELRRDIEALREEIASLKEEIGKLRGKGAR
jgi:MerR family transcriptional regulator/heat shock protein HspR